MDFEPLAETLPLMDFEPASGLASRLAAMNGAGNGREFCWDHFLDFERIAAGDPVELSRFSRFSGAPLKDLKKWTPTRHGNVFSINGETLTTFRLRRRRLRVCPACVEADLAVAPNLRGDAAVACRIFAMIDAVRTCPIHRVSLVQVADKSTFGEHDQDYAIAIGDALEDVAALRARSKERDLTEFEAYILGRLGVLPGRRVSLLDEIDISQVTTLCERLGVFDLHGRKAQVTDLDEDGMLACAEAGFAWCLQGEEGIRDFVTMAHERAVRDGNSGMSNAIFGRFHYFLNSETHRYSFAGLKQVIVDRLSELLPYGPDDTPVFGALPARRHWHTLVSAERQYGLPYRTIKKRVERAGIHTRLNLSFDKTRFAIPADDLDWLLTSPDGTMLRAEVIERTGAHANDFFAFEMAGILKPVSGGSRASMSMYRRGDVDDLEKMLLKDAVTLAGETPGWVHLHQAYLESSWSRSEVLDHIAQGKVPTGSVIGQKSIASLRVDLEALRRLHPFFGREVMSMQEAAALLEVNESVVNRLVAKGWIDNHAERSTDSGRLRVALCKSDVLRFQKAYIPISEVWRRRGGPMRKINPLLKANGLEPSFSPQQLQCTFYPRSDVDRVFPPPA